MRCGLIRVVLAVCIPASLTAQKALPRPEIGIRGGWMHFTQKSNFGGSSSFSLLALPAGAGPLGSGGVHATFFLSPRVALEPQVGLLRAASEGSDPFMLTSLAMQANGFLGDATNAPYLFAQIGRLQEDNGSSSEGQTTVGAGVGYRKVHRESVAMRYELRYRHWSGRDVTMNEFGVLIGVAAVIR